MGHELFESVFGELQSLAHMEKHKDREPGHEMCIHRKTSKDLKLGINPNKCSRSEQRCFQGNIIYSTVRHLLRSNTPPLS